ncbi:MAG TPA: LamG domain-containing protein [Kofleriaceae bacterium]|nr:LamG domain-containing protein [Kofleriaceae bacterium]
MTQGDASVEPAVLAVYRFEEATPFADSSGNGYHAACAAGACPSLTPDWTGAATGALFDGVDDLLTAGPNAAGPFTVMAWIRLDGAPEDLACPINRPFAANGANTYQICMAVPSKGVVRLFFYTTEQPRQLAVNMPMDVGAWHHVAIRWDGSRKVIFWDGLPAAGADGKTAFDETGIRLGSDLDGEVVVGLFHGALDELEIWRGALPETAIAAAAGG